MPLDLRTLFKEVLPVIPEENKAVRYPYEHEVVSEADNALATVAAAIEKDHAEARFCNELGCPDRITIEMWRNTPPFWLILNSGASAQTQEHYQSYVNRGLMEFYDCG